MTTEPIQLINISRKKRKEKSLRELLHAIEVSIECSSYINTFMGSETTIDTVDLEQIANLVKGLMVFDEIRHYGKADKPPSP